MRRYAMSTTEPFVPALRFHALTGLYDPLMSFLVNEATLRSRTLELLRPEPGERVLDLGCGTGSLAVRLKQEFPRVEVLGCDVDPGALGRARRKAAGAGVSVRWCLGPAHDPPLPDRSVDLVTSTLLLHHLRTDGKRAALAAALRLLEPGGRLVLADFTRPSGVLRRIAFCGVRLLDGLAVTADHAAGRLAEIVESAGFERVTEAGRLDTPVGTVAFLTASRRRDGTGA